MDLIQQLDFPLVPDELIESIDSILAKPDFVRDQKKITDQLFEYLESIFVRPISARYICCKNGLPPHHDESGRTFAYNFILDTGGRNVVTRVYDDELKIVQEIICQPKNWYKIPTAEWHSVHGIDEETEAMTLYRDFNNNTEISLIYLYNFLYNLNDITRKKNLKTIVMANFADVGDRIRENRFKFPNIYFANGYTPSSAGADSAIYRIPESSEDGTTNITYILKKFTYRVETPSAGQSRLAHGLCQR